MAWSALGVCALAFQTLVFVRWITAGGMHAVPDGNYEISPGRAALTWVGQGAMFTVVVFCVAVTWYRSRKAGRITFDTAIVIGFGLSFWLAPLSNARDLIAIGNRYALNVSTWGPYIPGWDGPHPELQVETVIAASVLMYIPVITWVWAQMWFMTRFSRRWPSWGMVRLLPVFLLSGALLDALFEVILVAGLGMYGYPSANQQLALFGGHWYQVPLGHVIAGILLPTPTAMVWLHARRRGREVHIFRGSAEFAPCTRNWLRILAAVGFTNLVMLGWMVISMNTTMLGTDPMPADMPSWIWPR
ncbi:spirocyclase AveC family protein [Streptomyces sp. NPDC002403]